MKNMILNEHEEEILNPDIQPVDPLDEDVRKELDELNLGDADGSDGDDEIEYNDADE